MPHRTRVQQPVTTHCPHSQLKEHRETSRTSDACMSGILSNVTVWREVVRTHVGALIALKVWRLLSERESRHVQETHLGRDCQKLLTFARKNFFSTFDFFSSFLAS